MNTKNISITAGLIILMLTLIPKSAVADQTQTSDYREWTQWLFTEDSFPFSNMTFSVVDPVGWSHSNGEAVLRIRGFARITGGAGGAQAIPEIFFDNHYLTGNQSLSGQRGGETNNNCGILGTLSAGATMSEVYTINKECPFDRKLPTIGTHGIRMRNRDVGTLATVDLEFSIIYRYHINYTQPGSPAQFNQIQNQTGNVSATQLEIALSSIFGTTLGTTSTINILVLLSIAIIGMWVWSRKDLFFMITGCLIVLLDAIIAIEFRNTWNGAAVFAILLLGTGGYMMIRGAMHYVQQRAVEKAKATNPFPLSSQ